MLATGDTLFKMPQALSISSSINAIASIEISAHISTAKITAKIVRNATSLSTPTSTGFGLSDSEIGILKSTYARSNIRHDAEAEPPKMSECAMVTNRQPHCH
jgi:hypothetical protein